MRQSGGYSSSSNGLRIGGSKRGQNSLPEGSIRMVAGMEQYGMSGENNKAISFADSPTYSLLK
jgi:hypothetical protein